MAPPNQGPNATPKYEATLGQPSVFTLANGMRVFAGPRDDAFYFDSGATFDYLNFRAPAPVLTGSADTGPGAAYPNAVDGFAGYNISLIAVEMPITMATANGAMPTDHVRSQRAHRRLGLDPAADRDHPPQPAAIRRTTASSCRSTASATRSRSKL